MLEHQRFCQTVMLLYYHYWESKLRCYIMQLMKLVLELCSFCQVDEMLIFQVARNDGLVDEKNTVTAGMKVSSSSSSLSSSSSSLFFQQVACHVPPLLMILTQSHKVLNISFLQYGSQMGSIVVGDKNTQSIPVAKHHIRRCLGMWLSNGLHHLWCEAGQCYVLSEECAGRFCGCAGVEKYHLLTCEWASCEQLHVNRDSIQQVVLLLLTFSVGAFHDPAWFTSPSFLE